MNPEELDPTPVIKTTEIEPVIEMNTKEKSKIALSIQGAIILGSLIIAGAILVGPIASRPSITTPTNSLTLPQKQVTMKSVTTEDHISGDPTKAKIFIVEYSDLECPYCKDFHETLHKLIDHYEGKVAWVYRHVPLDTRHPKARPEAYASECVAQIGGNEKFWKYIDQIFTTTQSNNSLDLTLLPKFATGLGIDATAFNTCYDSAGATFKDRIDASITDATTAGLQGTPYSVIITKDGKTFPADGDLSYETLIATIDPLVK